MKLRYPVIAAALFAATSADRGFRTGAADGVAGSQTESALREFQRSENLQATGRLNQATLQALGIPAEPAQR